ncbi:MAG: hypothetical protein RL094_354 [Candidatus Parcubacteria bacterium]|jgi:uncharacterized repeat protein (TIGR01451 family)
MGSNMSKYFFYFLLIATLSVTPVSSVFAAKLERPLTVGSSGDDVTVLQENLKKLGFFKADVNGFFGPITKAAVEAFQLNKGIASPSMPGFGYVGPKTRELFNSIIVGSTTTTTISATNTTPIKTGTIENNLSLVLSRDLYVGIQGEDVRQLQLFLKAQGFYTQPSITGYFGTVTKNAVAAFQRANTLPMTGRVGLQTRAKIVVSNPPTIHISNTVPTRPRIVLSSRPPEPTVVPATTAGPNLSVTVSEDDADNSVTPNQSITYTVAISNSGTTNAGTSFTANIPTDMGNPGTFSYSNCGGASESFGSPTLTVSSISISKGATCTVTFVISVDTPLNEGTGLTVSVDVVAAAQGGNNPDSVSASALTVDATPALTVTSAENDADNTVTRSQDITYTLTIDNTGDGYATGVDLTDTIVGDVSDVGTFGFSGCGSNYTNNSSGQTLSVSNVEIAVSTDCIITYHVSVDSDADHQGTITNNADVAAADEGGNNPNATSTSALTVDVPIVSYWADGLSVGNMDSSTNWQEQSGLATPHLAANSNYLWSVSDSPANQIQAINTTNAANLGILTLTGQTAMVDLEDIECASVGGTNYCYAMDFGNNGNTANSRGSGIDMRIFRFVEPTITGSNISTSNFIEINVAFPGVNGPTLRDAEATIADPDTGDLYIIPKRNATQQVYRLAFADQNTSGTKTLEYMGNMTSLPSATTVALGATPCYAVDAAISPDGREIFVKNYNTTYIFPRDKATQTIFQALQQSLTAVDGYVGGGSVSPKKSHPMAEPQGEGITFDYAGTNYYSNSEYVATEGSASNAYPLFKYSRLTGTPTTVAFQDGVLPTAGYIGTVTTYIWGTSSTTDRSAEATYVVDTTVGNATDDRRGLIKFDLSSIPTNATVVGATLEQWISAEGQGWKVYRMLVPWTGTSTYNSLVGGVTNDGVEASSIESYHNGVNLDTIVNVSVRDNMLVSDIQNMVTTPSTNYGWLVKGLDEATGDGVQFDGKAGATSTRRPKLTIRYITP